MPHSLERNLHFLFQLGSLRHIERSWRQYFGTEMATDLEHTMRVIFIALMLAKMEKKGDESLIIKMALIHDLAESITGDLTPIQKKYVTIDEEKAVQDMFDRTSLEEYIIIAQEYRSRSSIESKIVKDADNLDIDIELREMLERGHGLPSKWQAGRKKLRDTKLFTTAAKTLWDALQTHDASGWRYYLEEKP
jgi:putative hydrolase of HD superfamily